MPQLVRRFAIACLSTLATDCSLIPTALALKPEELYRKASLAVVLVVAGNQKSGSLGSGLVINPQGLIATNDHVFRKYRQIYIKTADGTLYPTTVVARNTQQDLLTRQLKAMHHKFALIPQSLLPEREKGSRIGSPSPVLGEGLKPAASQKRVRVNALTIVANSIAWVRIQPRLALPSLKLRTIPPQVGQRVYTIGNLLGMEKSIRDGIVSRLEDND